MTDRTAAPSVIRARKILMDQWGVIHPKKWRQATRIRSWNAWMLEELQIQQTYIF